jgi:nucleoside-diphosphate-sugar epimerase
VAVVSRSGGSDVAGVTAVAADVADAAGLTQVARSADVIYNCLNPAYTRWAQEWPPMARAVLTAAEASGAVLVTMSNLYGYGPVDGVLTEDLPLAAPGTKGRIRARMWADALAAHASGRVRVTEARASDFVGPRVTYGGHLGERVVPRVLARKPVRVLGSPDQPHTWTDVRDVARLLVVLGQDERAWGRAWHVPSDAPVSQREAIRALCRAAGSAEVPVSGLPGWVVQAAGVAVPLIRELRETRYQFERPFVMASSAATTTFGVTATPLERTWQDTVAWWRSRVGSDRLPAPDLRPA